MIAIIIQRAPRQQFSIYLPNSKTIVFRTPSSIIPGRNKIIKENYISTYGLTTLNKPKSREVSTNDGIITQNIFNAAVPILKQNKIQRSNNFVNI